MESGKSKPKFPAREVWLQWHQEHLDNFYVRHKAELAGELASFPRVFNRYVEECRNKSKLRRLLNNNTECNRAREELHGIFTTIYLDTVSLLKEKGHGSGNDV